VADNPNNTVDPTNTSLFYELAGAEPDGAGGFRTAFGTVSGAALNAACGVGGIVNSGTGTVEDKATVVHLLKQVRSSETNTISVGGSDITVFVAPVEGPGGEKPNPIRYRVGSTTNGTHNASGFDLWAVIKVRSGSRTIGNWKE